MRKSKVITKHAGIVTTSTAINVNGNVKGNCNVKGNGKVKGNGNVNCNKTSTATSRASATSLSSATTITSQHRTAGHRQSFTRENPPPQRKQAPASKVLVQTCRHS